MPFRAARAAAAARGDCGDRRHSAGCPPIHCRVIAVTRNRLPGGATIDHSTGGPSMAPTTLEMPEKVIDLPADLKPEVGRLAQDSITVTDNRTGKSYEFPITDGTIR